MLSRFDELPYSRSDVGVSAVDSKHDDTMSLVCIPTFISDFLKTKNLVNLINALHWGKNPDLTLHRYMINGSSVDNPLRSRKNSDLTLYAHPIYGSYVDKYKGKIKKMESLSVSNVLEITSSEQVKVSNFDLSGHHLSIVRATKRGSIYISQGAKLRTSINSTRVTMKRNSVVIHSTAPRRSVMYGGQCEMNHRPSVKMQHRESHRQSQFAQTDRVSFIDHRTLPGHRMFVTSLPLYRSHIFFRRLNEHSCVVGTSCPQLYVNDIYGREKISLLRRISSGLVKGLRSLMDFSIFSSFFFCTFVLSNCIYYLWSSVPLLFGTHHAINIGATRQDAALLLSYLGISNTVGLIFFGVIGDMDVNLLHIYSGAFVLAGFFVAVIPLTDFSTMIGCYVLFGFFVAVNYSLKTVILVQHLDLKKRTDAYGLLLLFQGIASFMGPVVAGYTADVTGDYNLSFYCTGLFFILTRLLPVLIIMPMCCTLVQLISWIQSRVLKKRFTPINLSNNE